LTEVPILLLPKTTAPHIHVGSHIHIAHVVAHIAHVVAHIAHVVAHIAHVAHVIAHASHSSVSSCCEVAEHALPVLPPSTLLLSKAFLEPPVAISEASLDSIRPVVEFFNDDLLEHLLDGGSIILNVIGINIPHHIHNFFRGHHPVAIVVVVHEKLLAYLLIQRTVQPEILINGLQEIVEFSQHEEPGLVPVCHQERLPRDLVRLCPGFEVHPPKKISYKYLINPRWII
jgi:hypothetical protein